MEYVEVESSGNGKHDQDQSTQYIQTSSDDPLALTLSTPSTMSWGTTLSLLHLPSPPNLPSFVVGSSKSIATIGRQAPRKKHGSHARKDEYITPPFIWATNRRATVHSQAYLIANGIRTISGDVQCKQCEMCFQMEYDLYSNFTELGLYIVENKHSMYSCAPKEWNNPKLPDCRFCKQQSCVKPLIARRKRNINWLFLLLGQLLGCCSLDQLKYFCKHATYHRTGSKDRVLYITYLGLCLQLDSTGPFDPMVKS